MGRVYFWRYCISTWFSGKCLVDSLMFGFFFRSHSPEWWMVGVCGTRRLERPWHAGGWERRDDCHRVHHALQSVVHCQGTSSDWMWCEDCPGWVLGHTAQCWCHCREPGQPRCGEECIQHVSWLCLYVCISVCSLHICMHTLVKVPTHAHCFLRIVHVCWLSLGWFSFAALHFFTNL